MLIRQTDVSDGALQLLVSGGFPPDQLGPLALRGAGHRAVRQQAVPIRLPQVPGKAVLLHLLPYLTC